MQPGISTHVFFQHRLHPGLLTPSPPPAREPLKSSPRATTSTTPMRPPCAKLAAWFRSNDVRACPPAHLYLRRRARLQQRRLSPVVAPRCAQSQPDRRRKVPPHRRHGRGQARARVRRAGALHRHRPRPWAEGRAVGRARPGALAHRHRAPQGLRRPARRAPSAAKLAERGHHAGASAHHPQDRPLRHGRRLPRRWRPAPRHARQRRAARLRSRRRHRTARPAHRTGAICTTTTGPSRIPPK